MTRIISLIWLTIALLSTITKSQAQPTTQTPKPKPQTNPPSLITKPTGEDIIRVQIFLDETLFGPGIIDGKLGLFTELAVRSWNETQNIPPQDWTAVLNQARKAVSTPVAATFVPELASDWVDTTLPTERAEQALRKRMSYRSYAEFMAERYHCDVPFLITLNGANKISQLKPKDPIVVPNVYPFCIEKLTGQQHPAEPSLSQRHVIVDTKLNQVQIRESAPSQTTSPPATAQTRLIASFPITPGQTKFIQLGTWKLSGMVELPWWRYDQQLLDKGIRSKNALNIPPGPNSPVGVIWNGTTKPGIGLHGTSDPETIGRSRSAGCIRLANWDAIRLPKLIRPGALIEIR